MLQTVIIIYNNNNICLVLLNIDIGLFLSTKKIKEINKRKISEKKLVFNKKMYDFLYIVWMIDIDEYLNFWYILMFSMEFSLLLKEMLTYSFFTKKQKAVSF